METILPSDWDLPPEIRSRVGHSVGRQRSMVAKGHLLILLHSPPRADEDKREPCLFWRDPGHNWRSRKFGTGTNGLSRYLEGYEKMTDDLQRRVLEEQSAQELFETLNEIGPLHRSARNTHTALQQAREMMADMICKWCGGPVPHPGRLPCPTNTALGGPAKRWCETE